MPIAARLGVLASKHRSVSVPVSLDWVYDQYTVKMLDLSPAILGVAHFNRARGIKGIGLNKNQHRYTQRMTLAHEVAHDVLEHPDRFFTCRLGDWWRARIELEAQWAASIVLVPFNRLFEAMMDGADIRDLEDLFEVDRRLIEIRGSLSDVVKSVRAEAYRQQLAIVG